MFSTVVIAFVIGVVVAQDTTTHRPHVTHVKHTHPTRHPVQHENYAFQYFAPAHQLVLKTKTGCFLMELTNAQQHSVHSPTGLHALESKLLLASDKTDTHTKVHHGQVDAHVAKFCRDAHHKALPVAKVM